MLTAVLIAQTDSTSTGSALGTFLPLVLLAGVFYLAFILPNRRRLKAMKELRSALQIGDQVRTAGGMFGSVVGINDDRVQIDVGGGTTITFAVGAIAERLSADEPGDS
ncbi:MAG: preprotein translocase subunit YajC [Acidimicrobiia bacterium]|nr:preprotein translocase subunit YajC [Acidimicrobiia bacterium]